MKTIVVTGATSGIGLGVVEALLKKTEDRVIGIARDMVETTNVKHDLNLTKIG